MRLVGRVIMWAGELSDANIIRLHGDGWLPCDGSTVSQDEYHELFDMITDNFKRSPDEVLEPGLFRLPDFRGRTAIGSGQSEDLSMRDLGRRVGKENHKLTVDQMPSHNHGGNTGETGKKVTFPLEGTPAGSFSGNVAFSTNPHSHTISPEGGDSVHNNMQPSLVVNYLILYKST